MSSSDAQQNENLKRELERVKAKNEKLEKELEQVKDKMNAKNEKLEKELRELKKEHQQQLTGSMDTRRVNCGCCHRRRNLPAELKVEIVDCFPLENAAHFLASVPNRLIIHHCAPRVRRMLKMIDQIAADYARTLPAANSDGLIHLRNGHQYTPEMGIFLRYGTAKCDGFWIYYGNGDGFVGYPPNFFDDLIKHCYESKIPTKAVHDLRFQLSLTNPAPWPAALLRPQAGEMNVEEVEVDNEWNCVRYILRNKHNPNIAFKLLIFFQEDTKCFCFRKMIGFGAYMTDVQSREARE